MPIFGARKPVKLAQLFSARADILPEPYLSRIGTLQDQAPPDPWDSVSRVLEEELRSPEVTSRVSPLSALPAVREWLLEAQRAAGRNGALGADGRDMGTVVFPDAQVKVFLTASPEERALRRHKQLLEKGLTANLSNLVAEIRERDERDRNRAVAPLKAPAAALEIESTALSIEEVLGRVLERVRSAFPDLAV